MPNCQRRTATPAEMSEPAHLGLDQGKEGEGGATEARPEEYLGNHCGCGYRLAWMFEGWRDPQDQDQGRSQLEQVSMVPVSMGLMTLVR